MGTSTPFIGLRASGGPLRATEIGISRGLNVLYGLNGAGKSSVLAALHSAVIGISCDYDTLLVVGPETTEAMGQWMAEVLTGLGATDERLMSAWGLLTSAQDVPDTRDLHLAREVLAQGFIGLRPVGRVGTPEWEVWACVQYPNGTLIEEEVSKSRSAIAELARAREAAHDPHDEYVLDCEQGCLSMPLLRNAAPSLHGHALEVCLSDCSVEDLQALLLPRPLPVPAGLLGRSRAGLPVALLDDQVGPRAFGSRDNISQPDELLREAARQRLQGVELVKWRTGEVSDAAQSWTQELQANAQATYERVLLDAPRLTIQWSHPSFWGWEPACRWMAEGRELKSLSSAQHRWADFSIRRALASVNESRDLLIVLDEPEAALHRAAESHMAEGLAEMAAEGKDVLLVATHCPDLLDHRDANIAQVKRVSGFSTVSPLEGATRAEMTSLGLRASDLLRRTLVFLFVEGQHDQLVFETLIGDRLSAARVQILPLRGAAGLKHLAEGKLLYDFTDADMVVVLDNLDAQQARAAWLIAKDTFELEGKAAAVALLRKRLPGKVDGKARVEHVFMREFLASGLISGVDSRVHPFGVNEVDIEHYLPVEFFVDNGSWSDLEREYAEFVARASPATKVPNYKDWLAMQKGADFSDATFLAAARALERVPQEFESLAEFCESVSQGVKERLLQRVISR